MSECVVPAVPEVHPALAGRFSPVAFDPEVVVTDAEVDVLLDAARLAPSAGNSQPWRFVVGRRGGAVHARMARHLARSSAQWSSGASLLVANIAVVRVEDTDWEYSEFSRYDLGQAVAHLTVQALAMGLHAHQFRAFDREALERELGLPPAWEVTSMTAIGRSTHEPTELTSAGTSRERLDRDAITWERD